MFGNTFMTNSTTKRPITLPPNRVRPNFHFSALVSGFAGARAASFLVENNFCNNMIIWVLSQIPISVFQMDLDYYRRGSKEDKLQKIIYENYIRKLQFFD